MIGQGGVWRYSRGGRFGVGGARNGKTNGNIGLERCDSFYEDGGEGLLPYTSDRPRGPEKCVLSFSAVTGRLPVGIAVFVGVLLQHIGGNIGGNHWLRVEQLAMQCCPLALLVFERHRFFLSPGGSVDSPSLEVGYTCC